MQLGIVVKVICLLIFLLSLLLIFPALFSAHRLNLLQELMTKLITEMPDHPIPFLIDHLQSKQGGRGQLQRTLSGSAALWAESETTENKGTRRDFRSYDKPWQINAKKPKKSKSDLAVSNISPPSPESKSLPGSIEHPKWDWRSKSEHRDFDELNHILQESKKLGKALENLSRSIAISDEIDKDAAAFNSPLLRPRVVGEWVGREENDADPLADEMLQPPIPRSKVEHWDSEDSGSPGGRFVVECAWLLVQADQRLGYIAEQEVRFQNMQARIGEMDTYLSLKMEPKTKGLKHQQQQHKKLLAAMLSQDSFDSVQSTAPSVTEEDIDNEDDAMELLEDLDDLRMEGVTGVTSSGSKFNQTRGTHTAEPQAKVTLNICARCARLQGDNLAERTEDASVSSQTPEQDVSEAVVPGAEISMESSEELENVPQTTERIQPVRDLDIMGSSSSESPTQKLLKDSLAAKELQTMEKHLADIAKDLALWEEGRLLRNMSNPQTTLVALDHQGNIKVPPNQEAGPQVPTFTEKDIQLHLQRNKSPPLPSNNRLQVSGVTNSRPPPPSTQTNRSSVLPSPANRAATPNALLQRPLSPSNQGNKEGIISMQRSQALISKNQLGRTITAHSGLLETSGDALGNVTQRSSLSEDEFLQQLQLVHQPWILPSDTESEGVEPAPDKCL
uniref:Chromosome 8 open reading frame 34 n=1 Tax=Anolis carolinensis TaxID=28377 RepID=A0A803SNJ1_ANOCA